MDQLFQLKQLRINGGSRITAPRAASASICSSSRRGIIFAITEFGLAVTKSDDLYHKLRSVEAGSEKWVDLRIGIDFTKIKLSCCQEFLLASHSTSLYIYRVSSLISVTTKNYRRKSLPLSLISNLPRKYAISGQIHYSLLRVLQCCSIMAI